VSIQIAKFEAEMGIKHIDRSRRYFRLTDGGELLLEFANGVLVRTNEVERSLRELKDGLRDR
jgi:DNA-binding transcriptional LysR family regulator